MSKKRKRQKLNSTNASKKVVYKPVFIKALSYDATRDPKGIDNHWAYVDSLDMDSSLSADVREKLRTRARYEIGNNSYAYGIGLTIANNVVGSGPRLQVLDTDDTGRQTDLAREIEWAFDAWAQEIRLAEKLRSMRFSRYQDGESFAILYTNRNLLNGVLLDISPIDCDRVQAGTTFTSDPHDIDGIIIDDWGNPVSYRVLNNHPGSSLSGGDDSATVYKANQVIHWFRRTRSEQHRGVTELAACLNLFALLRRYTESVVTAAETAADLAMIFSTDALEDETSYQYGKSTQSTASNEIDFPEIQFKKGMSLTLPAGWNASQIRAEQPTTTYPDFKRELLGEIGRSLQIPINIIAGDSSKYNYASGRLDHQEFQKQIRLDQALCKTAVMNPIFAAWWEEYALLTHKNVEEKPPVQWYFDGFEHVDPTKEANAQTTRLSSCVTNLMIECGKSGLDWEEVMQQRAREINLAKELGITIDDTQIDNSSAEENEEDDDEQKSKSSGQKTASTPAAPKSPLKETNNKTAKVVKQE